MDTFKAILLILGMMALLIGGMALFMAWVIGLSRDDRPFVSRLAIVIGTGLSLVSVAIIL